MKSLVLAVALAAISSGSRAAASNPLIGRWRLVSWQPNTNPNWLAPVCSDQTLVFTPKTVNAYTPQANPPVPVSYNIQPRRVVVSSANDVIYEVLDGEHIRRDDMGKCTYQRAR